VHKTPVHVRGGVLPPTSLRQEGKPEVPIKIIECPECPCDFEQHADLAGCYGNNATCPCSESKATLSEDETEEE
jgi:hypothetical protein